MTEEFEDDEEISCESISQENEMKLHALIELLISKKIITQEELDKRLDDLYPNDDPS